MFRLFWNVKTGTVKSFRDNDNNFHSSATELGFKFTLYLHTNPLEKNPLSLHTQEVLLIHGIHLQPVTNWNTNISFLHSWTSLALLFTIISSVTSECSSGCCTRFFLIETVLKSGTGRPKQRLNRGIWGRLIALFEGRQATTTERKLVAQIFWKWLTQGKIKKHF